MEVESAVPKMELFEVLENADGIIYSDKAFHAYKLKQLTERAYYFFFDNPRI